MAPLSYKVGLCLLGVFISTPFQTAVQASFCRNGWLSFAGSCYRYFPEKLTWQAAEAKCQSVTCGAHLASIHTWAEGKLVSRVISVDKDLERGVDVWTGLQDIQRNRKWIWSDGSALDYQNWIRGEPNNQGGNEYCGTVRASAEYEGWNDVSCGYKNAYICKYDI